MNFPQVHLEACWVRQVEILLLLFVLPGLLGELLVISSPDYFSITLSLDGAGQFLVFVGIL